MLITGFYGTGWLPSDIWDELLKEKVGIDGIESVQVVGLSRDPLNMFFMPQCLQKQLRRI